MSDSAENSRKTAKRPRGRPFPKGTSGNPGGRPKHAYALRELCKDHGGAALAAIVHVMQESKNDATRMSAAKELLERAYGPPLPPEPEDPAVRSFIRVLNAQYDEDDNRI